MKKETFKKKNEKKSCKNKTNMKKEEKLEKKAAKQNKNAEGFEKKLVLKCFDHVQGHFHMRRKEKYPQRKRNEKIQATRRKNAAKNIQKRRIKIRVREKKLQFQDFF